jgi:hypothetical protein
LPPVKGLASIVAVGTLRLQPDSSGVAQVQAQVQRTGSSWTPGALMFHVAVNGTPGTNGTLKVTLNSSATGAVQVGATVRLNDVKAVAGATLLFNLPSDVVALLSGSTAPVTLSVALSGAAGSSVDVSALHVLTSPTAATGQGAIGLWDQAWTTTAQSSLVASATVGSVSQKVCGAAYRTLESPAFNPKRFSWTSRRIAIDVRVPSVMPNPAWLGTVQLTYLNRSQQVTQFLGQVELTGLRRGEWSTVTFPLPESVFQALRADRNGSSFQLALNADRAGGSECFQFDNLRFIGAQSLNVALADLGQQSGIAQTLASRVFDFESVLSWHRQRMVPEPTLVMSPVTSGRHALRVPVSDWTVIESELFLTSEIDSQGDSLELEVRAPTPVNAGWWGEIAFFLECPSANLWNEWVGQAPVPTADGQFHSIRVPMPPRLAQALSASNTCLFRISINAPRNAGDFILDHLRRAP